MRSRARSAHRTRAGNTFTRPGLVLLVVPKHAFGYFAAKRIVDLAMSAAVLVLGAPVFLLVALAVRVFLGPPVLFRQVRVGRHGRTFVLYKFRTMRAAPAVARAAVTDAARLTRFGGFLRSTSLDELPQFVNVLTGDMSVVGPRPLLPAYMPLYSADQNRRHEVRPGLTGWAQVHGRNAQSWDERLRRDVWYVDHASMGLDLRIVLDTIWLVVRRKGISGTGTATMEPFRGTSAHAPPSPSSRDPEHDLRRPLA